MLMNIFITSFCTNIAADNIYNNACTKAMEASTKQIGFYQTVENTENNTINYVVQEGYYYLGSDTMDTIGGLGYSYRIYKNKSIAFKLPTFDLCSSVTNTITPTSYTIHFEWKLP